MNTDIRVLLKAVSFAARAHKDQIRKDGVTPYASHPSRVGYILQLVFGVTDVGVLAAGVLHDTIEDTTTDYDDIQKEFGRDVAVWVGLLSKDKRKHEAEREAAYIEQLSQAPDEVKIIKLADIYDNLTDASTAGSRKHIDKTLERASSYLGAFDGSKNTVIVKAVNIVTNLKEEVGSHVRS